MGQGAAKVGLSTVWQSYSQVNAYIFFNFECAEIISTRNYSIVHGD